MLSLHGPRTAVLLCFLLMSVLFQATAFLNCSQPDTKSLLAAFKQDVYNLKDVRPVEDLNKPLTVMIFFSVYGILDVDEKAQLLTTFIWLSMVWTHDFAKWDPMECGIYRVTLPRTNFWIPDVIINEFMEANSGPKTEYLHVLQNGVVIDQTPVKVVSSCNLDTYLFPFDIQNCTYSFSSFLHTADAIRVKGIETEFILNMSISHMEMGEWEFVNVTSTQAKIVNTTDRDYVYYHLILRRQPTLYVVNLLVPSCFLMTLDLCSFMLPPQSVDRSAFKMTLILGYTVFLLLMNDLLPVTGSTIPLINVFFSICLSLMVASLLETIVITNIIHSSRNKEIPKWVRVLILQVLARLVCLARKKPDDHVVMMTQNQVEAPICFTDASESPGKDLNLEAFQKVEQELQAIHKQLEKNMAAEQLADDWILIGTVVDRFLFWVYLLFITVSFTTILVMWFHWHNSD